MSRRQSSRASNANNARDFSAADEKLRHLAQTLLQQHGAPEHALLTFRDRVRSHHDLLSALADFYLRDLYSRIVDGSEAAEPTPLNIPLPRKNLTDAQINAILADMQSCVYDAIFDMTKLQSGRAIGNLLICELNEFISRNRYEERLLRYIRTRTKKVDPRLPIRRAVKPEVVRRAKIFAEAGR